MSVNKNGAKSQCIFFPKRRENITKTDKVQTKKIITANANYHDDGRLGNRNIEIGTCLDTEAKAAAEVLQRSYTIDMVVLKITIAIEFATAQSYE